jgi:hypothetical protein
VPASIKTSQAMEDLASQIFTGDNLFPFEIGEEVDIPGGIKGVVVMGSTMHSNVILGEHFLIRVSPIDKQGNFNEDQFEIFTYMNGRFYC